MVHMGFRVYGALVTPGVGNRMQKKTGKDMETGTDFAAP